MSNIDEILAAAGISAGVKPYLTVPSVDTLQNAVAYPTALVTSLSLLAVFPTAVLLFLCVRFNRLLFALVRAVILRLVTSRSDFNMRLTFEFGFDQDYDQQVVYSLRSAHELIDRIPSRVIDEPVSDAGTDECSSELNEIIVVE